MRTPGHSRRNAGTPRLTPRGKALFESGSYTEASEAFTRANGYQDAEALAEESLNAAAYTEGKALFESGSYADALEAFTRANGYKDAEDMAEETRRAIAYESGKALFDEENKAHSGEMFDVSPMYYLNNLVNSMEAPDGKAAIKALDTFFSL